MTKPRLSAEEKNDLAKQLQAKLRQERPRRGWRLGLALLALAAIVLVLRHFNQTPPESPPILLACLEDAESVGRPLHARAWLQAAGGVEADAAGLPVTWRRLDADAELSATKTDAHGMASVALPVANEEVVWAVQASYLEPRELYRRDDQARLFAWSPTTRVLVVPLVRSGDGGIEIGAEADRDVAEEITRQLVERIKNGGRIVYATTATEPRQYRDVREWLRRQTLRGVPDGPVMLATGPMQSLALELGRRFGADNIDTWPPAK
jgi:hypothetical protein